MSKIPKKEYEAMRRLCDPLMEVANAMSGEELALAMKGFYATSETNCPWFAYALKHIVPPILAAKLYAHPATTEALKEVREALTFFASVADEYDDSEDDSFEVWQDAGPVRNIRQSFRLEHYRRARQALSRLGEGTYD